MTWGYDNDHKGAPSHLSSIGLQQPRYATAIKMLKKLWLDGSLAFLAPAVIVTSFTFVEVCPLVFPCATAHYILAQRFVANEAMGF